MDVCQADKVREIIRAGVTGAQWLAVPDEFHSGDEIGFNLNGACVRATVKFDKAFVYVHMTSPVENSCKRMLFDGHVSFFHRLASGISPYLNGIEGGPASPACISAAKNMLEGIYSDWYLLNYKADSIKEKMSRLDGFASKLHEAEMIRISQVKDSIFIMSRKSGDLKRQFKQGVIRQQEYVERKQPIHREIVALQGQMREKDPFLMLFSEELDDCLYASDKISMIKSICV